MGKIKITTTINRENFDYCKSINWKFSDVIFWAVEKRKNQGENDENRVQKLEKLTEHLQVRMNLLHEKLIQRTNPEFMNEIYKEVENSSKLEKGEQK